MKNKNIVLKTKIKVKSIYKGKSKFDFWNNLKIDEEIEISLELDKSSGKYGGGVIYLKLFNCDSFESIYHSYIETQKYLKNIEYDNITQV